MTVNQIFWTYSRTDVVLNLSSHSLLMLCSTHNQIKYQDKPLFTGTTWQGCTSLALPPPPIGALWPIMFPPHRERQSPASAAETPKLVQRHISVSQKQLSLFGKSFHTGWCSRTIAVVNRFYSHTEQNKTIFPGCSSVKPAKCSLYLLADWVMIWCFVHFLAALYFYWRVSGPFIF